ncbi:MAG TPA: flagellar hook-basal body complex protein FliE [Ramlibacter sp.]|jgi:flagellar hook-basal body complex protein FliE|uniref:flagellar hook-basal body complex protein FliE n=1 Tax=Ramlibacter sp. TaxID=1917967 RepID=UPI002D293DD3|nr:flagellar hook-basal body complex protein FliE [Ramlibacter sp.]HZY19154.1 flagellar hook-basal body complex protein FliE [Ramlibacter sp.]
MNIPPVASGLPTPLLDALRRNAADQARQATPAVAAPSSPSFVNALDQALRSVSATQHEAGALAEAFQADPSGVSLEQAMVAMQKSQIGFQSALHVRNRLVSAYSDIMNMQV